MGQVAHIVGYWPQKFARRGGPETVNEILDRTGWYIWDQPCIVIVRKQGEKVGNPVMQRDWGRLKIADNDDVIFLQKPAGGRGTLAIGAMIAIALAAALVAGPFAPLVGGAIGGAVGLTGVAFGTTTWASIFAATAAAGIAMGGQLLVNAFLMPKPEQADTGDGDIPPALMSAGGNVARPFETIPVPYGKIIHWPPLGAPPTSEFRDNEQTVSILLCQGPGKYDIHEIRAEDTKIWDSSGGVVGSFAGRIKVQIRQPGEKLTLFAPTTQSAEVDNLELPGGNNDDDWGDEVGWFNVNAADTEITEIWFDYILPGLYELNNDNELRPRSISIKAEIQEIDAAGDPIGSIQTAFNNNLSKRSREQIRKTVKVDVNGGRWRARMSKKKKNLDLDEGADTVIWYALRAKLDGNKSYPDTCMVALQFEAEDNEIASTVQNRINTISTKWLNVYRDDEWHYEPSRNPVWAAVDIWTNETYGGANSLEFLDLDLLKYYADLADNRPDVPDTFNYVYTGEIPITDAMHTALQTMRSVPLVLGNTLSIVRDEPRSIPSMLIDDTCVLKGSFEIKSVFQDSQTADDLIVVFMNEETWEPDEVRCTLAGSSSVKPVRIRIPGITNREQAWREGMYAAKVNRERRQYPSAEISTQGRHLKFGDWVRVSSDTPGNWGETAIIIRDEVSERKLWVDPAPSWGGTQRYIEIRTRTGGRFGPIRVSQGARKYIAVLDASDLTDVEEEQGMSLAQALDRQYGALPVSCIFGTANRQAIDAMVLSYDPSGSRGRLNMVLDDPSVHTIDETEVIPTPNNPKSKPPNQPVIYEARARIKQRGSDRTLEASWTEAYGAKRYQVDVSNELDDTDREWTRVYRGTVRRCEVPLDEIATKCRIRAIGKLAGPWIEIELVDPSFLQTPTVLYTPFTDTTGKRRGAGVHVSINKARDFRYEGWVIEYWPTSDPTQIRTHTVRSKSRTQVDIYAGIRAGIEYAFQVRYILRGGIDGLNTTPENVTALDPFDAVSAPVPVFTSANITSIQKDGPNGSEKAGFALTIPDPGDARVTHAVVQWKKDGEADTEYEEKVFKSYTTCRLWDNIRSRQSYTIRVAYLFDGVDRGNFCIPVTGRQAVDAREDDVLITREGKFKNGSFERLNAAGTFPKFFSLTGSINVAVINGGAGHRDRFLRITGPSSGSILMNTNAYYEAKPGQVFVVSMLRKRISLLAPTWIGTGGFGVRFNYLNAAGTIFDSITRITSNTDTSWTDLSFTTDPAPAGTVAVGADILVSGLDTGQIGVDFLELDEQIVGVRVASKAIDKSKFADNAVGKVNSLSSNGTGIISSTSFDEIFGGDASIYKKVLVTATAKFRSNSNPTPPSLPAWSQCEFRLVVEYDGVTTVLDRTDLLGVKNFAQDEFQDIVVTMSGVYELPTGVDEATVEMRIEALTTSGTANGRYSRPRISWETIA